MAKEREIHPAASKAQLALAAHEGDKTINELAGHYAVHPTLIHGWKKHLVTGAGGLFAGPAAVQAASADAEARQAELFERVGRLEMELEWTGKKRPPSAEPERAPVDQGSGEPSIRRPCELLGLSRSSFYDEPAEVSAGDLRLMGPIGHQYTARPFFGGRRRVVWPGQQGGDANRERTRRPMRVMGPEAIHPGPRPSLAGKGHRACPCPLRGVKVERVDQVRSTDITCIPMASGFMYLAAVIDRCSRHVTAWRPSNRLDGSFCTGMLDEALGPGRPEVFDTGRGVQFAASAFTWRPGSAGVAVSMDGRGRALDDVPLERPWGSVKCGDVCIWCYETVPGLRVGLGRYFGFCDRERPHRSLDDRTPGAVYREVGATRA